jgi:hypothetical protein
VNDKDDLEAERRDAELADRQSKETTQPSSEGFFISTERKDHD